MKKQIKLVPVRPTVMALALATAFSAQAQIDPERAEAIAELAMPRSVINLGVSYLSDDSRRFGQYSGQRDAGAGALIDLSLVDLDKDAGTWTRLVGRNLGLASREAQFEHERQGRWRYFLGYSQTPRYEPYVVTTAVSGIGSSAVNVPTSSTTGKPIDLSLKRELVSAGFDHALGATSALRVRFSHETKEGSRLYGRGTGGAIEFLPEPDDRTTETLETALSYTGKDLQLSGGYYGTLFVNHASALTVTGGNAFLANPTSTAAAPNAPFTPMSQPLNNHSHQLFLTGGYNLTPLSRMSFKLSETIARQDENFIDLGTAPRLAGAPRSLNGRVDTTLAYLDLTSFEFDRLDLQANLRYEDRDDKTPEAKYMSGSQDGVIAAQPSTFYSGNTGFNKPRSWSSMKSKLEAGYALPANFKLAGGWELDQQRRNSPEPFRKVNFRTETDETTLRLELKRAVSDALSASLGVSQARRTGSDYLPDTYDINGATAGAPPSNAVNPLLWADRDRAAWKLSAEWSPLDRLALHLVYEQADDEYSGRALGPREGSRKFASIDASYAISDRWQGHAWWSQDDIGAEQRTQANPASPTVALRQFWQAKLVQASEGVGVGVNGRMRRGVELGAEVSYSKQAAEQRMEALTGPAITSLPDYFYRLTEVRLFASLPLDPASGLRFDYAYYDWKTNDWTWSTWTYTDGTRLSQEAHQKTQLVGLSYYYRWR